MINILSKKNINKDNKNSGFSLIELMVAISIIAILTGVIMANFNTAKSKSRDAKRISDIAQIQLALGLFFEKCNQYPQSLAISESTGCPSGITLGTFISKAPTPPSPQPNSYTNYQYVVDQNSSATDYRLGITLENSNQALNDDMDDSFTGYSAGSSATLNCADSSGTSLMYCVSSR